MFEKQSLVAAFALLFAGAGCLAPPGLEQDDEDADDLQAGLREDTSRAPIVVRVPVRFTRNSAKDVGVGFRSSWVPFTGVGHTQMDGFLWGYTLPGTATHLVSLYQPDAPGAGYATAYFSVEIPYDTTGRIAYGLTRVKLESQFFDTTMATTVLNQYSPLRVRSGSDQPCLSVTMGGALDGKLKAVPLPFTDEGFTERDWNLGDTDDSGVPITQVIVGTFRFAAYCWPENVEGETSAAGGLAVPPGAFIMLDKTSGQGESDASTVYVNLVENKRGEVSVGETFSTNGGILGDRDRKAFDDAVLAFGKKFAADVEAGIEAASSAPQY